MSAFEQFAKEKSKIDAYVEQQYIIAGVREGLSGDVLELKHPDGDTAEMLVETAEARKYFVNILIKQSQNP